MSVLLWYLHASLFSDGESLFGIFLQNAVASYYDFGITSSHLLFQYFSFTFLLLEFDVCEFFCLHIDHA